MRVVLRVSPSLPRGFLGFTHVLAVGHLTRSAFQRGNLQGSLPRGTRRAVWRFSRVSLMEGRRANQISNVAAGLCGQGFNAKTKKHR
jgi:hypothetical protein